MCRLALAVPGILLGFTAETLLGAPDFSRMTALGDSLTAPSPFLTYPELIALQLGEPLVNLAVGGSTSATLLAQGQHTRAVDEYHTTFAFLWIGGNDMRGAWGSGELRSPGATGWIDTYAANFTTALDTLLAGGADVIVANLMDYDDSIGFPEGAVVPPRVQPTVRANIEAYAARLQSIADARNVPVVDMLHRWEQMLASPPIVYGHPVTNQIGSPYDGRPWADQVHPNQLGQVIVANGFIDTMNSHWGLSIPSVPLPEPATFILMSPLVLAALRRSAQARK
jgi:lysophospholipase L1-like esterase